MEKISVVLATYNGALFLKEQLLSLLNQTRCADEVLICDDCSKDNTVEIIKKFITDNNLVNWHLDINAKNLGWRKNFFKLIFAAQGSIIFYCDQDDVWFNNKIELMTKEISLSKEVLCLACHYASIDDSGTTVSYTVDEKSLGTCQLKKIDFRTKRFFYPPSGCTLAFRKDLLKYLDTRYLDGNPDAIIGRTASLLKGLFYYDQNLMYHRFHSNNASLGSDEAKCVHGNSSLEQRQIYVQETITGLEKSMRIFAQDRQVQIDLAGVNLTLEFLNARKIFLERRTFLSLLSLLSFCQNKTYASLVFSDICYVVGVNKLAGRIYGMVK